MHRFIQYVPECVHMTCICVIEQFYNVYLSSKNMMVPTIMFQWTMEQMSNSDEFDIVICPNPKTHLDGIRMSVR